MKSKQLGGTQYGSGQFAFPITQANTEKKMLFLISATFGRHHFTLLHPWTKVTPVMFESSHK